jgi:hypothetical protein
MTFSERETFIQTMTVMITSDIAKRLPREVRTQLLSTVRDTVCPSITNDDWKEIAVDINNTTNMILKDLRIGLSKSQDSTKTMEDPSLLKLDAIIHDNIKDIDFDKLDLSGAPEEVKKWVESKRN